MGACTSACTGGVHKEVTEDLTQKKNVLEEARHKRNAAKHHGHLLNIIDEHNDVSAALRQAFIQEQEAWVDWPLWMKDSGDNNGEIDVLHVVEKIQQQVLEGRDARVHLIAIRNAFSKSMNEILYLMQNYDKDSTEHDHKVAALHKAQQHQKEANHNHTKHKDTKGYDLKQKNDMTRKDEECDRAVVECATAVATSAERLHGLRQTMMNEKRRLLRVALNQFFADSAAAYASQAKVLGDIVAMVATVPDRESKPYVASEAGVLTPVAASDVAVDAAGAAAAAPAGDAKPAAPATSS